LDGLFVASVEAFCVGFEASIKGTPATFGEVFPPLDGWIEMDKFGK
jgi:hypothetical protein